MVQTIFACRISVYRSAGAILTKAFDGRNVKRVPVVTEIDLALNDAAWYRPPFCYHLHDRRPEASMRTVLCVVACLILIIVAGGASPDPACSEQSPPQITHSGNESSVSAAHASANAMPTAGVKPTPESSTDSRAQSPPLKAHEILQAVQKRHGDPLPGYVGGRTFQNRERRLPSGRYREYDVNPKTPGRNRGPERVVIEQRTGKAYYTGDHYVTFIPLN
jgi:guanyl-specific ribonuclease Sa